MSYIASDEQVADSNKFSFRFDEAEDFRQVDVKRGQDRFRQDYHEVCLTGYRHQRPWDLADWLEENSYRLVDAEATGLTYYSPDGKTEVYLDEASNVRNEMCRLMILRGELTEGELPTAEQEVRALFYDLSLLPGPREHRNTPERVF